MLIAGGHGAGVAGPTAAVCGVIVAARADRDGVIAGADIKVVTDLTRQMQRHVAPVVLEM